MRCRRRLLTLATAVLLMVAASCGTGGGSDKVKASEWAGGVCKATKDWVKELKSSAPKASDIGNDPKKAKAALVKYFRGAGSSTDDYIGRLDDAGTPDVPDGEGVSDDLKTSIERVKTALDKATSRAEKLPTDDRAEFGRQTSELGADFSTEAGKASSALKKLGENHKSAQAEIKKAFKGEPACASLDS